MNVSDIGGTVILLLVYIALYPLMQTALEVLLPQLGPTESFIASAIPLILLIMIVVDAWESGPQQTQITAQR